VSHLCDHCALREVHWWLPILQQDLCHRCHDLVVEANPDTDFRRETVARELADVRAVLWRRAKIGAPA